MLPINLVAVLVAAVVAFVIGFLFHGPLFGKLWMKLANIHPTGNEKLADMVPQMFWNLFVNIVTAYAIAVVYVLISSSPYVFSSAIENGMLVGFIAWLGFLAPATSIEVIWMGHSFKLWLFELVSSFVVMLTMGAIIGGWH